MGLSGSGSIPSRRLRCRERVMRAGPPPALHPELADPPEAAALSESASRLAPLKVALAPP